MYVHVCCDKHFNVNSFHSKTTATTTPYERINTASNHTLAPVRASFSKTSCSTCSSPSEQGARRGRAKDYHYPTRSFLSTVQIPLHPKTSDRIPCPPRRQTLPAHWYPLLHSSQRTGCRTDLLFPCRAKNRQPFPLLNRTCFLRKTKTIEKEGVEFEEGIAITN